MIPSSTEIEQRATKRLEESSTPNGTSKFGNTKSTVSSSRQWSAFRNPRIVRVSRSFGGKDRHSKVCTVRGLRDRRIRLSVPTAIQLYDLQERLGLSQPSKVIDWLIENTKEDIDKLPPLQLPQGSFGQFLQQSIMGGAASHNDQIADQNMMSNSNNLPVFLDGGNSGLFSSKYRPEIMEERSKYWDYLDAASKAKSMEVERDNIELNQVEKAKTWMEMSNHFQGLRGYNINNNNNNQVSAQNFFPVASDDPYNQSWDTTSTPRLAAGSNNDHSNCKLLSAASSSTFGALIPSGGPQLFFCPPPSTSTTVFPVTTYPPYPYSTTSIEADPTQVNSHIHLFSPSSSIKTFQLNNKNPKHLQSQSQGEDNSSS